MNILISVCGDFLVPAKVMLYSLSKQNKDLHIYLIYKSLSDKQLSELTAFVNTVCNSELTAFLADDCFTDAPLSEQYGKPELYFRLLAPYILPQELDRILYLDADIIIKEDLSDFYYQQFSDEYAAIVKDRFDWCDDVVNQKNALGMPAEAVYFNSGVILFNLTQFRKYISLEDILEFIKSRYNVLKFFDQDTLNILLLKHKKLCDEKWNFQVYPFEELTVEDVKDMAVVHFTDHPKPWSTDYSGKLGGLYWDCYNECINKE